MIPQFPEDFDHSIEDSVDISKKEINKWIKEEIEEMNENGSIWSSIESGNTIVIIKRVRQGMNKYSILVSKDYYEWDNLTMQDHQEIYEEYMKEEN